MKRDYRLNDMLNILSEETFTSTESLCGSLKVSEKTIRRLSGELSEILSQNGASLEKKYGKGLRIFVKDRKKYEEFSKKLKQIACCKDDSERVEEILYILLIKNQYIKIDDMCEMFYVSRKIISSDLKKAEKFVNHYQIKMQRKPYYGINLSGREFDFRQCIQNYIFSLNGKNFSELEVLFENESKIRNSLSDAFYNYGYHVYESEIKNIIAQFQITIYRIQTGNLITMDELNHESLLTEMDINAANACVRKLHETGIKCSFPIPEVKYIAVLLSGKKRNRISEVENLVIDMEINQLVNEMLRSIKEVFYEDLYEDFELQTSLRQHLVALRIRLQYRIQLKNPVLNQIRESYSFPFALAAQAATVLAEYFHTIVTEDEIGYIAMCIALSLERRKKKERSKKNIILVCESGVGTAKLFQYRFEENFGAYLNQIEVCDVHTLMKKDLENVDYIFSTVPIQFKISVPICQVQYFFDSRSISRVKSLLKKENDKSVKRYFSEDLFFIDVEGDTREAVIHQLCRKICERKKVPDEFEACVLKREKIMQTDFGSLVALPHPYAPVSEETFVCVAILKRPILWYIHPVQVVFLLSISVNKENLEDFYNVALSFMMDEDFIKELIETKDYQILLDMIQAIERDEEWRNK